MSIHSFKTLFAVLAFSLLTTHCAAQSSSLVPNSLSSSAQDDFREIAHDINNPCAEEDLLGFSNLEELLEAGKTCHDAYILASEIEFFLRNDVDKLRTLSMVKDEAKSMVSPAQFNMENRPRLGSSSAPVEIVIFSDFQCPFCAKAATTVHKVYEARPDVVSVVFKQMPLTSIHPFAAASSLVSLYAHEKGQFWETHDLLFKSQKELSAEKLTEILEALGATPDELFDPEKGQKYGVFVIEDVEDAKKANVEGTPSLFVNGVAIDGGGNYDRLIARVDAELQAPAQSSPQARAKAREKALKNCPYEGHEELYALLPPSGQADLALYTSSVLCPCPGVAQTLHDCTISHACDNADPLVDKIITRIMENTPKDDLVREIEYIVQQERTKMQP